MSSMKIIILYYLLMLGYVFNFGALALTETEDSKLDKEIFVLRQFDNHYKDVMNDKDLQKQLEPWSSDFMLLAQKYFLKENSYSLNTLDLRNQYAFFLSLSFIQINKELAFALGYVTYLSIIATIEFRICALYYGSVRNTGTEEHGDMCERLANYFLWYYDLLLENKISDLKIIAPNNWRITGNSEIKNLMKAFASVDLKYIMKVKIDCGTDEQSVPHYGSQLISVRENAKPTEKVINKLNAYWYNPSSICDENEVIRNTKPALLCEGIPTIFSEKSVALKKKAEELDEISLKKNFHDDIWKIVLCIYGEQILFLDNYFSHIQFDGGKKTTIESFLLKVASYKELFNHVPDLFQIISVPYEKQYMALAKSHMNVPIEILRNIRIMKHNIDLEQQEVTASDKNGE